MKRTILLLVFFTLCYSSYASSEEVIVRMQMINEQGTGKDIGTVTATDSNYGLILTPELNKLQQGIHGFHVHQNPDCGPALKAGKKVSGEAAGGHFDPGKTGRHEGPYGKGHLGDLPALYVGEDGKAKLPVLAPRLKAADLKGRSLMIHAGGDNYSDQPSLGGGGGRIACGVIQ